MGEYKLGEAEYELGKLCMNWMREYELGELVFVNK